MAKTILLVDDKKMLRESLMDYLSDKSYDFIEAESGEKALELYREKDVDLVLLDNLLPGINGIRVLQLMKKIKKDIPIIGLTGELNVRIREDFLRAGGYDVQAKSAIYEKLIPSIESALKGEEPHRPDFEGIDYDQIAEELKNDGRWEESALYLKEAGLEQEALGNMEKFKEYFDEAILRYERAGRISKAKELQNVLDKTTG